MIFGINNLVWAAVLMVVSFLPISLMLNALTIKLSTRYHLFMDKPNSRSSHVGLIPRCGGLSICLIVLLGFLTILKPSGLPLTGYLLGALLITIVGITDDLFSLSSKPKIAGMVTSALIPLLFGLKLHYLEIVSNNQLALYILSFIWIYGCINAFNFMDGIDGLVGGAAAIGAFFIFVFAVISGDVVVGASAVILLATCLGFLVFNFSPASIFLGDAGSMFLGYNFAVLGIMLTNNSANSVPIYVFLYILAPIIYDAMVTFVRRGLHGRNVIEAHREHLYQRLVILGISHRIVSFVYYSLALLFGLMSLIFYFSGQIGRISLSILAFAIMIGFSLFVAKLEILIEGKVNG